VESEATTKKNIMVVRGVGKFRKLLEEERDTLSKKRKNLSNGGKYLKEIHRKDSSEVKPHCFDANFIGGEVSWGKKTLKEDNKASRERTRNSWPYDLERRRSWPPIGLTTPEARRRECLDPETT